MSDFAKPIGLLGAYERDNFGDLLFLERTQTLAGLEGFMTRPLVPFGHTPERLTGKFCSTLPQAIAEETLGGLWTVGGEVGAVPVYAAYKMLAPEDKTEGYESASRRKRRRTIRQASGMRLLDLAYLPVPSDYSGVSQLPTVINSVGLTGVKQLRGDVYAAAVSALRQADFVSVRERESAALLEGMGIGHFLAPDLVHSLRSTRQDLADQSSRLRAEDDRHAVVQISEAALRNVGVRAFASALGATRVLRGREVRLFAAGTSPHHDSLPLYRELLNVVAAEHRHLLIRMSSAVDPMEKVEELATSFIVIGTSLHAMIVSMTFDIPHVGLLIPKVSRYARAWGDPMPTEVALADLEEAATLAVSLRQTTIRSGLSVKLSEDAVANFKRAIDAGTRMDHSSVSARAGRRASAARDLSRQRRHPRNLLTSLGRSLVRPLS